jgi:hypothetical protein
MKLSKLMVALFVPFLFSLGHVPTYAGQPATTSRNYDPAFSESFNSLLKTEDYSGLNALVANWNNSPKRDEDGGWIAYGLKRTLDERLHNRDWEGNLRHAKAQQKRHSKSPVAALMAAYYWTAYAWNVRGSAYAVNVDPFAKKLFLQRMKHAERILLDSKPIAAANPFWYEIYLNLAIGSGRSEQFIDSLFAEAVHRHAGHYPLYTEMADYWLPKSGAPANWAKLDQMINQAVSMNAEMDGASMYARLYNDIIQERERHLDVDPFRQGRTSWQKMRKSFDDLVRRYPTNGNFNRFAAFACRANDRDTFLRVRQKIGSQVEASKWPHNISAEMCERRFLQYKY